MGVRPFVGGPIRVPGDISGHMFSLSARERVGSVLFVASILMASCSSIVFRGTIVNGTYILCTPSLRRCASNEKFCFSCSSCSYKDIIRCFSRLPRTILTTGPNRTRHGFGRHFISLYSNGSDTQFIRAVLRDGG